MIERIRDSEVARSRTILLPNWVDTDHIYPLPRPVTFRERLGIREDQIAVLYSGNMGHKQGLQVLIEAAEVLSGDAAIRFILRGEGASRMESERSAADLHNVQFLGLQPEHALNLLLGSADIHVLPQREDVSDLVMPSKLGGMLASGRPVLATVERSSELGRILGKVGVIVPPGDSDSLAAAILELARNPQRSEERRLVPQAANLL